MTHMPKHPNCPACQSSKAYEPAARAGTDSGIEEEQPKEFGDCITADHIDCKNPKSKGSKGEAWCLSLLDLGTGYCDAYALTNKDGNSAERAFRDFIGPHDFVTVMYTDGSQELTSGVKAIGVPHKTATPGRSTSNSRAERQNRTLEEGTRTILNHAGVPSIYWPHGSRHFCLALNMIC